MARRRLTTPHPLRQGALVFNLFKIMRDIKFRFWVEKAKQMCEWETAKVECDRLSLFTMEGFIPMQYTGLKDKAGVEIFEGDILKCDFSRDNNGLHDSIQVVEFYEGSFGSRHKNDHFRIPALFSGRATEGMNLNYYEVIGNIHEHPELCSA